MELRLLRLSIAFVWIATALVSALLYPPELSYQLLARRRWLWLAQLGLIGFYTALIAWKLPEFLLHPYGPLTKNIPLLAAIWLLYRTEET